MNTINILNAELSRRDKSFLNLAMRAAASSDCMMKHGAVVVRGGSVLSIGHNKRRSEAQNHYTVHAEIDALSRVQQPKNCTVYVARVSSNGDPMLSRPCDVCYNVMEQLGVKKVIHT